MKQLAFILCALMAFIGAQAAETAEPKTYDLTICKYESEFFEADNDVYMTLYTEDNVVTIRVDIIVEEGQQYFTNGKTYTWDDMLQKYCNAYVSADFQHYQFADATFTWHLDELGLEHMAGSGIDSLGNIYNFHYDVLPYIPTGDTIDVTIPQPMRLEHSDNWYFTGSNDEYSVLLALVNDGASPVGHYTNENIDMDFSYIEVSFGGGEYEYFSFHDAEIDITEAEDDTLKIEALIAALDTNVYRLHAFYLAPKPTVKKNIEAKNLYINTDYLYGMIGAFQVEASNDTHYIKFAFSPMSDDLNVYDTYSISNVSPNLGYVTDYLDPSEEYSEIYEGTVTISKTENGAVVTGTILCYNNTEYTLNLYYAVPEKTHEEDLIIDGLALQISNQGAWRISGFNAAQTQNVSLVFNGFGIEGTYSIVEMSAPYSYVVTDILWTAGEIESYNYYEPVAADLTATLNETDSVITVTGTIIAQNSENLQDVPQFNVRLTTQPVTEDVESVRPDAVATKRMENGMIIIEKNGVKYTVTGQIIQ